MTGSSHPIPGTRDPSEPDPAADGSDEGMVKDLLDRIESVIKDEAADAPGA